MKQTFFNCKGKYHRYIYFIIAGLLLGSFFGSLIHNTAGASPTWWDTNFVYCKSLHIGYRILGVPLKIAIGNISGGNVSCGGHIKEGNWFKDLRFVNSANDTELYFWVENCTNGVQATIWVNNSANASCINMYYDNPTCSNSTYRNATHTFWIWSTGYDASKWTNTVTDVNGELYFYWSGTSCSTKLISMSKPFITEFKFHINNVYKHQVYFTYGNGAGTSFGAKRNDIVYYSPLNTVWKSYSNGADNSIYNSINVNTTYIAKEVWKLTGSYDHYLYDNTRSLLGSSISTTYGYGGEVDPVTSLQFCQGASSECFIKCYVTWIFCYRYHNPMPYWVSFSTEYSYITSTTIITLLLPLNSAINVIPNYVIFGVTVTNSNHESMTLTFHNNYTGDFETYSNVYNGTYYFVCDYPNTFNRFNTLYTWRLVVVATTSSNNTGWLHFTTTSNLHSLYGINGTNGLNGHNGTNGINGTNGVNGINGINGVNGINGLNGHNGTNGINGTNGVNGINGLNGHNGTNGTFNASLYYDKTTTNNKFVESALSVTPDLLFLIICLSLWVYFMSKYFEDKSMMLGLCIFGVGIPLLIALSIVSLSYPFGFIIVFVIGVLSLYFLIDGIYYKRNVKKKRY